MIEHLIIGIAFCAQAGITYLMWSSMEVTRLPDFLSIWYALRWHNRHLWPAAIDKIMWFTLLLSYAACAIIGVETVKQWLLGLLQ